MRRQRRRRPPAALPLSCSLALSLLLGAVELLDAGGLGGLVLEDPTGTAGMAPPAGGGGMPGGLSLGAPLAEGEEAFSEEDALKQEQLMSKIEQRKAEIEAQTTGSHARAKRKSGSDVRESMLKRKKISTGAGGGGGDSDSDDPTEQLPLRERIKARKAERKAERQQKQQDGGAGAGSGVLGWFRVDEGGAVAFRNTPALSDRSAFSAQAGDLIQAVDVREGLEDPGDWVQHSENKLWLPVRFLLPVEAPGANNAAAAAAAEPSVDCVDKSNRCVQWAADGDCEKNLKFVMDQCPFSCGLCELRQTKEQQRRADKPGASGGAATAGSSASSPSSSSGGGGSNKRRLEEEAAAAAMLGVGAAAGATYPSAEGGGGMAAAAAAGMAAAGLSPPSPPPAPVASFRLEVDELHGCETATDVPIKFVLPEGFTLGVDGRACFDIFRAPLGVTTDTGQLYHSRTDGMPARPPACPPACLPARHMTSDLC
jgi:hypothetical protein